MQAARNWQQVVKGVVGRRAPATLIVSESSSADMFGSTESLIGRIRHRAMEPMGSFEYLRFRKDPHAAALERPAVEMRSALAGSVGARDARTFA